MPIAVMSTARLGALRNGLYATFSITTPKIPHPAIASTMASQVGTPDALSPINNMYAPTMMISPWAKLIIFAIPYTIVYPNAINA